MKPRRRLNTNILNELHETAAAQALADWKRIYVMLAYPASTVAERLGTVIVHKGGSTSIWIKA